MKNLKKVLALVLAFACAFTMFASAAFTDEADFAIDTEVVDVLVSLGVIEGYEDGSFQPDKTVTRAEMAKMIYILRTGKSDASAYNNDTTTFTDISSHWARGYIKYCQALGIIAGKSTTIFDPNATVTTQEAAKMLLVTLGYDAEKAGLTGTGWGNRTNALADENGLLEDVDCGTTAGAPRQYAAQLIYNTIFAPTVMLRDGEYTNQAYTSEKGYVAYNATVGEKYMDLVKSSAGILLSVDKVEGKDYFKITTTKGTYDKVPKDVSDLMGQEIKVLQKNAKDSSKNTVYGVYADDDSKVIATGYLSTLKAVSGSDDKKIKLNGTEYKLDDSYKYNVAKVYTVNDDTATVALNTLNKGDSAGGVITAQDAVSEIKLIDNDGNGKVDNAVYYPVCAAKVTSVSSSSFTVKYLGGDKHAKTTDTIDFDDADVYSGIAKDDYVTILEDSYSVYDLNEVSKIDVTTGKVTAIRTGEARIDGGDWMKWTEKVGGNNNSALTNGSTYDLTIYGGVIIDSSETAADSSSVAFISGTGSPDSAVGSSDYTLKVRMYFQDGSDDEVKVEKYNGNKLTSAQATQLTTKLTNKLVTYSKLSNGNYDIRLVGNNANITLTGETDTTSNLVGADDLKTGTNIYSKQKLLGYAPNDDAVIFVNAGSGAKVKVLTGKQVKNWADSLDDAVNGDVLVKKSSGINYVKFAALTIPSSTSVPGATADTKYGYLTSDPSTGTANDEKNKAIYNVWTGSENVELYADTNSIAAGAKAGAVISYEVDGKWIENIKVLTTTTNSINSASKTAYEVAITGKSDDNLAYTIYSTNATAQYDFDDDCVFIAINDKDTEGVEGGKANLPDESNYTKDGTAYKTDAYVVLEKDGSDWKIVAVVFDTKDGYLNNNHTTTK